MNWLALIKAFGFATAFAGLIFVAGMTAMTAVIFGPVTFAVIFFSIIFVFVVYGLYQEFK